MTDILSIDNTAIVALRLKEARLATGMSTRAVSDEVSKQYPGSSLSHTSIAKYEKGGRSSPPVKVISMLAEVYERPAAWFLEKSKPLQGIRYRDVSSKVLVRERNQFEVQSQHWLEAYLKLERRLKQPLVASKPLDDSYKELSPVELAKEVRRLLDCKDNVPIFSVIGLMETFGIRVIELQSSFRIDGLAALFGNEFAVVLNPSTANDRCRMNAAHELAHVLYGDCHKTGGTTRAMDDRAFEFACNLLIPREQLEKAFLKKSAIHLIQAKEHFGISMAAMVYRAEKLGIISERTAKKLWIQFAKRGWRANEPGVVKADRATRFESMLQQAVAEKSILMSEAASLMCVSRSDLELRMAIAMGCLHVEDGSQDNEPKGGNFILKIHR